MLILITYDVSTGDRAGVRRLRRVARACLDYSQRVQNSVFECRVDVERWVQLRARLLEEINLAEDSLRFYFLDRDVTIEHHGTKEPVDLEAPLIF
jgi:CRISPR-associated protein Cas2